MSYKYLGVLIAFFCPMLIGEIIGEYSFDNRYFFNSGMQGQERNHSSFTLSPEIFLEEENSILHFKPKLRKDNEDNERNLVDIQELYLINLLEDKEIKYGVSKEFWGVTETTHRVDIINQTDTAESFDGEDKLGQPMVKVSFEENWGLLDLYALFGFRERTYPGNDGRLRQPMVIDTDNPQYLSSAKNKRVDFAFRWSNYFDQLEIAISHFSGTSREPRFVVSNENLKEIIPLYEVIDQTGFEFQYLVGSLAIKSEIISRSGQRDRFTAATYGFEYTQVGILSSRLDLGWIIEANHDDRLPGSPAVIGSRLTFNDTSDTQILMGIIYDERSEELGFLLEASRRLGICCSLSIEGFYFDDTNEDNEEFKLFQSYKEDDFLRFEFIYYIGD